MPSGLGRKGRTKKCRNIPPRASKKSKIDDETEEILNVNSASATKLKKLPENTSAAAPKDMSGNRIIDMSNFINFIRLMGCSFCHQVGKIGLQREFRQGLYSKFEFICEACKQPYSLQSCEKTKSGYTTNVRLVVGIYGIGSHRTGAHRLCTALNIPPPPVPSSWSKISEKLHNATMIVAEDCMIDAVREYKEDKGLPEGALTEATASFDGTWQRRGFQSKNGVTTAVTVNGNKCKVIDTVTLSNHCDACSKSKKLLSEEEFMDWRSDHLINFGKNYDGSAGSMEPRGIEISYRTSVQKYNLQYTGYLGDGDSKSFSRVASSDPPIYPGKSIKKLECCGHIQKKIYNRMKKVVDQNKGKKFQHNGKVYTGLSGKGLLTDKKIKRMQGHYGAAIRGHPCDVPAMKAAVWAIFYHRSGIHDNCSDWCAATKGDLETANKNVLLPFILEAIRPVFEELASDTLLNKCKHGGTQNANESFHHLIWQRCPKSIFVGRKRLEIAVADATIVYNEGEQAREAIYDKLGIEPGVYTEFGHKVIDNSRILKSIIASTKKIKELRKERQIRGAKTVDCLEVEYIPGGF